MENNQINFRLHGLEIIGLTINPRPIEGFTGATFNFNYTIDNTIDDDRNLVISIVKVEITELGKTILLGNITVGLGIEVVDLKNALPRNSENKSIIPQDFDLLVKTMAISTTRGIMFSEFKGTYLHNAILPIVIQSLPNQTEQPPQQEKLGVN